MFYLKYIALKYIWLWNGFYLKNVPNYWKNIFYTENVFTQFSLNMIFNMKNNKMQNIKFT